MLVRRYASVTRALLAFALASIALPRGAQAYSTADAFMEPAANGGGGGRWFTGSPAEGYGCSVCHEATSLVRHYPLYVAGLPLGGYSLAERQEVVLSWPEFTQRWFEVRPDPTVTAVPGVPRPAVGLLAELVAESGRASGTIEIDPSTASAAEQCEQARPGLQPRLGVKLYQVRSGVEPLLVKPDSTGKLRCEARQLGQRCLVALSSCGAQQMRFQWIAPPTWEGPIWFSAGFVATDALSGSFDLDSVQEISVPLVQADGESGKYQQTLRNGCSLTPRAPASHAHGSALLVAALALVLGARGRARRTRRPA